MVARPCTRHGGFARHVLPEIDTLYRVARTLTGQAADAEDLVQDTLLRAYCAMDTFDGRHARAWLLTILRNTEHSRHRRRRPELLHDPDGIMERLLVSDRDADNPEHVVLDGTFTAEVERAFTALPRKHQEVVAIVDVEGINYADAAVALGVPVGTVLSRLHRARKQIRRHLTTAGENVQAGTP